MPGQASLTRPNLTRRGLSRLLGAAALLGGRARAEAGPYDVVLESNVRVAARDGVKLATDVYRPARREQAEPRSVADHPEASLMRLPLFAVVGALLAWTGAARAAELLDATPRTAVITAFAPEIVPLAAALSDRHSYKVSGTEFITGTLEGKPVVLFLSGVSMVNAAMNTQRVLDRFRITRIVFSGIAGGVDPSLDVGDVVAPDQWGEYLESVMAREDTPGHFASTYRDPVVGANFGMIFPKVTEVTGPGGKLEQRAWFPADPGLIALARKVAPGVTLKRCSSPDRCLEKAPKVVVGGNGVSGQSFVDNAAFRTWAFTTFQARVLDMETAAVGQVAYANGVPFVGFRSLSDLAGGDPGRNQAGVFFPLASDNSAAVVRAFVAALP